MRIHVPKWANHLALAVIAIILEEKSTNIVNHVWIHVKYAFLTKCEIKMAQAWSVNYYVDKKRTFFSQPKKLKIGINKNSLKNHIQVEDF